MSIWKRYFDSDGVSFRANPLYDRFWRIVLKKSTAQSVWDVARDQARVSLFVSGRRWGGQRDQLCQLSEVLDCSSEEELVLSTGRASQPEPV
jgi:hypothetical protein